MQKWRLKAVVVLCAIFWGITLPATGATLPGAADFMPTMDNPVGWRGDGTGRYPGATPPISWSREATQKDYSTKGIVWMTPLPSNGVSSPIVVGDKVFLTSEVSDLICLEKTTGRVLWIRSNAEFEGLSKDERGMSPMYSEKLPGLTRELEEVNGLVVNALNSRRADAMTQAPATLEGVFKRKREMEKKIEQGQLAAGGKKKFERYWGQAVFGFSGPTPTSDGKLVCVFFTTGVTACYDLEGNRKWITRGGGNGSEHGNFASPLLCGNRLVVWANEMRGYDVETGKLVWSNPAKAFNTYGSLFRLTSGGETVACFQWGFFTRVRDGKLIWDQGPFGDSVQTPIVDGETIIARVGYPKANDKTSGLRAFAIPATTENGKIVSSFDYKIEWAPDEIPADKDKSPFDRGYVASPLLVDGLIYQVTQGGGLVVNEAATGALVYKKVLPLKPRTHYWDWAGCGASPTMAGKYIYLMDNQGTTLVIKPGRKYEQVASNFIAELRDGKEQAQNLATPVFEGTRMYYRTPGYLYCIGE